jgi:hypothetical protein
MAPSENPEGTRRPVLPAIARYVMGLPLLVFGLNFFLNFIPQPKTEMAPGAAAFLAALMATGYMMKLIGATFVVVGAFLVSNRFVPLAIALFAPFILNSLAFHLCLERSGLPMAIVFLGLELFLAWSYRRSFTGLLASKAAPG